MRHIIKFERPDRSLSVDGRILGFTLNQSEEETIINVQGVIGDTWDGLDASSVVSKIQDIQTPIVLRLNTPGGYVHDALDVYDALVEHPHNVRADIVSEAWSAGTIITSAADEIRIRPAARYGVHRAWAGFLMLGNGEEMREQIKQVEADIETLEKLDVQIATLIAEKSGNTVKDVHDWMIGPDGCDGTEFIGAEAVEAGLADSLIETKSEPAKAEYRSAARERAIVLARKKAACLA